LITRSVIVNLAFAPDDGRLVYAAHGYVVAISQDAGATWTSQWSAGVYASHIAVALHGVASAAFRFNGVPAILAEA
jgi:hypothetical protein